MNSSLAPPRCPSCGARIPGWMRKIADYCPYCGAELWEGGYCEECGQEYESGRYCPRHGVKLKRSIAKPVEEGKVEKEGEVEVKKAYYAVGQKLLEMDDIGALIQQTLQILKEDLSYKYGGVYLREGDYLTVKGLLERGGEGFKEGDKLKLDEERTVGWVIRHGKAKIVEAAAEGQQGETRKVKSELAIPLKSGEELLGVLRVESSEKGFREGNQELLEDLASHLAMAISQIRSKAELEAVRGELEYKNEFLRAMNEADEPDKLMEVILKGGLRLINRAEAGGFLLLSEEEDAFEFKAAAGWDPIALKEMRIPKEVMIKELDLDKGPTILAKEDLQRIRKRLPKGFCEELEKRGYSPTSSMLLPIRRGGRIIGYLGFSNRQGEEAFEFEDLNKLWSLITEVELAVKRAEEGGG